VASTERSGTALHQAVRNEYEDAERQQGEAPPQKSDIIALLLITLEKTALDVFAKGSHFGKTSKTV
jgi:hypothetical protein